MKELMDEMLALHKKFIETHGKEGELIDFSGKILFGSVFEGTNLDACIFNNAQFHNSSFIDAQFLQSNLFSALYGNQNVIDWALTIKQGLLEFQQEEKKEKERALIKARLKNRPTLKLVRPRKSKPPKK
jgi:uncharacterized protein YjbI with pentapeptide repeats